MGEFRKIKSLKFLYEINEDGVLRNIKSKKIIKGYVEKNGYVRVRIENKCLGGVVRTSIHQLVAEAFIPNPNNYPMINHKDSNRQNNNVNNLEWCTQSMNMKHACTQGNCKDEILSNLAKYRQDKKKITNGEMVFESISQAGKYLAENGLAKNYKSGVADISAVLHGRRKTFGGFEWKYI